MRTDKEPSSLEVQRVLEGDTKQVRIMYEVEEN
jgi:hypothetical protein